MGRFLNSDIVYDTDAGLQGHNLFVYCGNNPINRIDASGADSDDLLDGNKEDETFHDHSGGHGRPTPPGVGNYTGNGRSTGNSGGNPGSNEGLFLPDKFYSKHAPLQSTPNSEYTNYTYNAYTNQYEMSTAYYDSAGRQIIRIDWTNHGRFDHGDPHIHFRVYNAQFPDGYKLRLD